MFQELLPWLPREGGTLALALAMAGTLAGVGLWLMGARVSRGLITLMTVALGGVLGMELPRWYGWSTGGAATIIAGAILLGILGFTLHRVWVGLGLGMVLALWTAVGVWVVCGAGHDWTMPAVDWASATLPGVLVDIWHSLPEEVVRLLPWASATAVLSGLACALLWPRVGVALLYSMVGVSLIVGMGWSTLQQGHPQWLTMMPGRLWTQLLTLAGLVAFGVLVQCWQMSGPIKVAHHQQDDDMDDD
jgi:hypothetical protein